MVKENVTTNHIEKQAENLDTDDLEVSDKALLVPKQSSFTPLVDVEWAHPMKNIYVAVFCIFSKNWA